MSGAIRHIILAQISLFATFVTCVAINAEVLVSHSGMSFYGNFSDSLVPYLFGLGLSGYFMAKAASALRGVTGDLRLVRTGLRISSIALAGIILSPTLASDPSAVVHLVAGVVLFGTQAVVMYRLQDVYLPSVTGRVLALIQLTGLVIMFLSFRRVAVLDIMLPGQAIALLGFTTQCIFLLRTAPVRKAALTVTGRKSQPET